MHSFRSLGLFCLLLSCLSRATADETLLPLGAADLTPDARFESFKGTATVLDLEKAFEIEAVEQLDLGYELEEPSELEILQRENRLLKIRVGELERRLAAVEAKLAE